MISAFKDAKCVVCVGSGGVGKTTVASAIAWLAASEGKKAIAITVDPSQRLKTTLGLNDGQSEGKVSHPDLSKGQLTAVVINPKEIFESFIRKAVPNQTAAEKLLKNRLYQQLTTQLSGSQEFTALEKLHQAKVSGLYDFLVLDTPPAKHAMDFLKAPQRLSALFQDGVMRWFQQPKGSGLTSLWGKVAKTGTQQVLKVLDSLTGAEFIGELSGFFASIDGWQNQIEDRINSAHQLLVSPTTHFVLVTSFDEAKLREAEIFSKEIRKNGYHLTTVIINRATPIWKDIKVSSTPPTALSRWRDELNAFESERERKFSQFSIQMKGEGNVIRLPELDEVSDQEGVMKLAHWMKENLK